MGAQGQRTRTLFHVKHPSRTSTRDAPACPSGLPAPDSAPQPPRPPCQWFTPAPWPFACFAPPVTFSHLASALSLLVLAACGNSVTLGAPTPDAGVPITFDDATVPPTDPGAPFEPPDPASCGATPNADSDRDGWSIEAGDCNDCTAQFNPSAYDSPATPWDEDCDGQNAAADTLCDGALAIDSNLPGDAARAIDLCSPANQSWGLLSSRYTRPDLLDAPYSDLQHGLVPSFGAITPRVGQRMLALSTGYARAPGQPGYTASCPAISSLRGGTLPTGFIPRDFDCTTQSWKTANKEVFDPIVLELELKAPSNADGLRFYSNFLTYEFPNYVCYDSNDFYIVTMDPPPLSASDGNVVFDADGNRISVHTALMRMCTPGTYNGVSLACELGAASLQGTGFGPGAGSTCADGSNTNLIFPHPDIDAGAGTGWLETEVEVEPGATFKLRFMIWDSGDAIVDSTVLIDGFQWLIQPPSRAFTAPI